MSRLADFLDFLLQYNVKINLVSRRLSLEDLNLLADETDMVERLIGNDLIVDIGSGNGLLGIPIAIARPASRVFLVESIGKKCHFLKEAKKAFLLKNVEIYHGSIDEFIFSQRGFNGSAVSRGFPRPDRLFSMLKAKMFPELILVTSRNKAKKIVAGLENLKPTIYNIPWRDQLIILKATFVSRET